MLADGVKFLAAQGDAIAKLQTLPDEYVDLFFIDPPYNIGYEYFDYDDNREPDDYLGWCEEWLNWVYDKTAKNGSLWLAISDEYVSELDVIAKTAGFNKRSHVIWYYTFGVSNRKNYARSHTHLLYYTKHKKKFVFNSEDSRIRVPSARQLIYKDKRANSTGKLPDNTWVYSPVELDKAFSITEDTWLASRVCGTFKERHDRGKHQERKGCPQMPLAILDRIILSCSNPDQIVCDPMAGTFSTGESALRAGRRFIGYDISKPYVLSGSIRLKKVLNNA